jgi:hypothetical protein
MEHGYNNKLSTKPTAVRCKTSASLLNYLTQDYSFFLTNVTVRPKVINYSAFPSIHTHTVKEKKMPTFTDSFLLPPPRSTDDFSAAGGVQLIEIAAAHKYLYSV